MPVYWYDLLLSSPHSLSLSFFSSSSSTMVITLHNCGYANQITCYYCYYYYWQGDPAFVNNAHDDAVKMMDKEYASQIRRRIVEVSWQTNKSSINQSTHLSLIIVIISLYSWYRKVRSIPISMGYLATVIHYWLLPSRIQVNTTTSHSISYQIITSDKWPWQ